MVSTSQLNKACFCPILILDIMYGNGNGVLQDYAEAVKWYRLSAEQGDAGAQTLGVMRGKVFLRIISSYVANCSLMGIKAGGRRCSSMTLKH